MKSRFTLISLLLVLSTVLIGWKGAKDVKKIHEPRIENVPEEKQQVLCIWNKQPVDVLERAHVFSPKMGSLPPGTRIRSYRKKGDFYWIDYKDLKGYVFKDFCEEQHIKGQYQPVTNQGQKVTNSLGMEFVYIPPGTFMMGSPSNESGRYNDEKQHWVTLTRKFYIQTTEVTQGQW